MEFFTYLQRTIFSFVIGGFKGTFNEVVSGADNGTSERSGPAYDPQGMEGGPY